MPIIDVELVGTAKASSPQPDPQRLADALGKALDSPAGQTWMRLRYLPRDQYAENGAPLDDAIQPVFVTVMEARRPAGPALADRVTRVTTAVADAVGRDRSCVHVMYAEDGAGRVAFGGKLVT